METNVNDAVKWEHAPLWWLHKRLSDSLDEVDVAMDQAYRLPLGDHLENAIQKISNMLECCDYISGLIQTRVQGGIAYAQ